jgi:hypothetical protein
MAHWSTRILDALKCTDIAAIKWSSTSALSKATCSVRVGHEDH